jgi:hypothetical protein
MGGVAGVAVATGVSTWLSASAAAGVSRARAEKDDKVTTQREITALLKNVEIDISMFEQEKMGLVRLTIDGPPLEC